jgi:hypothetical protein
MMGAAQKQRLILPYSLPLKSKAKNACIEEEAKWQLQAQVLWLPSICYRR